jgi:putative phage-type endonuclease
MIEQRTEEWFNQRKGRLTASIAGAALGLAPYMTPQDARDVINGVREFEGNAATDYGTRMEPVALQEYALEYGYTVEEQPFIPYEDWSGASPDGLVRDPRLLVEIKCPYGLRNDNDLSRVKTLQEQPHYYAQVQLQMHFTGVFLCHFVTYLPLAGINVEVVPYDSRWVYENLPKLRKFWEDATRSTADLEADVEYYLTLKAKADALRDDMKETLARIVEKAGEPCRIGDHKLVRTVRQGSIAYSKVVKELLPGDVDLEPYRGKPSESWSIR